MAPARPAQQRTSSFGLIAFLVALAVAAALYFSLPAPLVLLIGVLLLALAEPAPVYTGPKSPGGYPTLNTDSPTEVKADRRWRVLSMMRSRLLLPNADWFAVRGVPFLPLCALALGVLATLLPVSSPILAEYAPSMADYWPWIDAVCVFLLVHGIAAGLRHGPNQGDPPPLTSLATLGQVGPLRSTLLAAVALAACATFATLGVLGTGTLISPVLPGWCVGISVGWLAFVAVAGPGARKAARAQWVLERDAASRWATMWPVALGTAMKGGAPRLLQRRTVGGITTEIFDVPLASGGAEAAHKAQRNLHIEGHVLAVTDTPQVAPDGQPIPGSVHPTRIQVLTWPVDALPDLRDPSMSEEEARLALDGALAVAVPKVAPGKYASLTDKVIAFHVPATRPVPATGWGRLLPHRSRRPAATPDSAPGAQPASSESLEGQDQAAAAETGPSPVAVWQVTLHPAAGGQPYTMDHVGEFSSAMLAVLAPGTDILLNIWYPNQKGRPGAQSFFIGGPRSEDLVLNEEVVQHQLGPVSPQQARVYDGNDEPFSVMIRKLDLETKTRGWWSKAKPKEAASVPSVQFLTEKHATYTYRSPASRTPIRCNMQQLAFATLTSEPPEMFFGREDSIAAAMSVPFTSIVGFQQPKAPVGERHSTGFTLRWSDQPVPPSAAQLVPVTSGLARMTNTSSTPEHWILAGMISRAFDSARLARPEVVKVTPLSRPSSPTHLWQAEILTYGGVELTRLRQESKKIRGSLGVEWLQFGAGRSPQHLIMVLGASWTEVELADPGRDRPRLIDLDLQTVWVDARVVSPDGQAPSIVSSATMPRNEAVTVLDLEIPSVVSPDRVRGAREKIINATRNQFVQVVPSPLGAGHVRMLMSPTDPVPYPAPPDWDYIDETADDASIPFATGVDGEPVSIDLREDPHGAIMGTTGSGKAQPLDSQIPVPVSSRFPDGWATIGDLRAGDRYLSPSGGIGTVVDFSDVAVEDVYVLSFDDGQEARCSGHHVWEVSTRAQRAAASAPALAKGESHEEGVAAQLAFIDRALSRARHGQVATAADIELAAGLPHGTLTRWGLTPKSLERTALFPSSKPARQFSMDEFKAHMRSDAKRQGRFRLAGAEVTAEEIDAIGLDGAWLDIRALASAVLGRDASRAELDAARLAVRHEEIPSRPGFALAPEPVYPVDEVLTRARSILDARSRGERMVETSILHAEEMVEHVRTPDGALNYSIKLPAAVDLPEADLPVEPYVMGFWLGGGCPDGAGITVEAPDRHEVEARLASLWGPVWHAQTRDGDDTVSLRFKEEAASPHVLEGALQAVGVLSDKHIPPTYLRASIPQRMALLQGLMDCGGSIDGRGGCELTLREERLAEGALELVRSLGIKATMVAGDAAPTEAGPGRPAHEPHRAGEGRWTIRFTTDEPVFRLERKLARIPKKVHPAHKRLFVTGIRVEKAAAQRCLRTTEPEHMYLTGGFIPTHNSAAAQIVVAAVLSKGWDIVIADVKKKAADFRFAAPWLHALATEYDETVAMLEAVYAEVQRRAQLNAEHGVGSSLDLPPSIRPNRLVVLLDEFNGLITIEKPARPVTNDPEALARYQQEMVLVAQKQRIGALTGYLTKEARSTGVTVLLSGQAFKQDTFKAVPGGSDIKAMLSRLALGKMSYAEYQTALREPDRVPALGDVTPKGRGVYESQGAATAIVQTWWAPDTQNFYAEQVRARRAPLAPEEKWDLAPFLASSEVHAEGEVLETIEVGDVIEELAPAPVEVDLSDLDFDLLEEESDLDEPELTLTVVGGDQAGLAGVPEQYGAGEKTPGPATDTGDTEESFVSVADDSPDTDHGDVIEDPFGPFQGPHQDLAPTQRASAPPEGASCIITDEYQVVEWARANGWTPVWIGSPLLAPYPIYVLEVSEDEDTMYGHPDLDAVLGFLDEHHPGALAWVSEATGDYTDSLIPLSQAVADYADIPVTMTADASLFKIDEGATPPPPHAPEPHAGPSEPEQSPALHGGEPSRPISADTEPTDAPLSVQEPRTEPDLRDEDTPGRGVDVIDQARMSRVTWF